MPVLRGIVAPVAAAGGTRLWPASLIEAQSDQQAIGTWQAAWRAETWLRAGIAAGAHAGVFGVRHGLRRDQQPFGPGNAPAGPARLRAGFLGGAVADEPRAALAAREVLSAGGTRGGCGGGPGLRAERHAAVARRPGRRRRLPRLCRRQEVGQRGRARGGDVHPGRPRQRRRERRSAGRRADAARAASICCTPATAVCRSRA